MEGASHQPPAGRNDKKNFFCGAVASLVLFTNNLVSSPFHFGGLSETRAGPPAPNV